MKCQSQLMERVTSSSPGNDLEESGAAQTKIHLKSQDENFYAEDSTQHHFH